MHQAQAKTRRLGPAVPRHNPRTLSGLTRIRSPRRRRAALAPPPDRVYFGGAPRCSLRLAAQDVALSRRKQGFESPRERQVRAERRLMFHRAIAAAGLLTALASGAPAAAQQVRAGLLTCDVSAGIGLIITSQKDLTCVFAPDRPDIA